MRNAKTGFFLFAAALSVTLLSLGCAAMMITARVTDLKEGRTLDLQIPNIRNQGGALSGTASDGEAFTGNYAVIPGKPSGSDLLLKVASAVAWDQGFTQLSSNLDRIPNREEYSATLTGNRGTVIDLIFAINTQTGHGTGSGKDNRGVEYRIQL
jgi:hypothetical protein